MLVNNFSRSDLKVELFDLAMTQGIASQEEWDDLVDEVVETHVDLGQLDKDQDTENTKEYLRTLWGEYKTQMSDPDAPIEDQNEENI